MRPRYQSILVLALLVTMNGAARGSDKAAVLDTSHTASSGERVLEQSVTVSASVKEVWDAFTTGPGFQAWAAPVAHVEFRLGGIIESNYKPDAVIGDPGNIRNEIVAYVPERMLAFRNVQAPPVTAFDVPTFQRLHTVVLFEPVGVNRTRVTIVQPGYGEGDLYNGVYRHFQWGNRWSLEKLMERFEKGPAEWGRAPAPSLPNSSSSGEGRR
jgi:uncharacterized protein YndB with AHSA1/START domain